MSKKRAFFLKCSLTGLIDAFVYLSNYIPQVFFWDANKGISALITGGFSLRKCNVSCIRNR